MVTVILKINQSIMKNQKRNLARRDRSHLKLLRVSKGLPVRGELNRVESDLFISKLQLNYQYLQKILSL
jgi:hypothetical protein